MKLWVPEINQIPALVEEVEKGLSDEYREWKRIQTPKTPLEFALPCYMGMLSGLAGPMIYVPLYHLKVQPNVWALLIAVSSRGKKSTILDLTKEFVKDIGKDIGGDVLSILGTFQGLRNIMALPPGGHGRSRGIIIEPEMGEFFASLGNDKQQGGSYWVSRLYDPPRGAIEITLANQIYVISKSRFVAWVGGIQTATLWKYARSEHVSSGLFHRFVKVWGEAPRKVKQDFVTTDKEIGRLKERIKKKIEPLSNEYAKRANEEDKRIEYPWYEMESWKCWKKFEQWVDENDDGTDPAWDRLENLPLTYAPLIAIDRGKPPGVFDVGDMELAIKWTLAHIGSQIRFVSIGIGGGKEAETTYNMLEFIVKKPGIDGTMLSRRFQHKDRPDHLRKLREMDYIRVEPVSTTTNKRWTYWPTDDGIQLVLGKKRENLERVAAAKNRVFEEREIEIPREEYPQDTKPEQEKPIQEDEHKLRERLYKLKTKGELKEAFGELFDEVVSAWNRMPPPIFFRIVNDLKAEFSGKEEFDEEKVRQVIAKLIILGNLRPKAQTHTNETQRLAMGG